jgi:DNA modification methylase
MLEVTSIPDIIEINENDVFEIKTTDVAYFSHSFFKYPAKFIPQIPNWAIKNFTSEGDFVLDCFAGSGTTILEASLLNRIPLAIDFDKISNLLSIVKTTKLSKNDVVEIKHNLNSIMNIINSDDIPNIRNINHWFPEENILKLNSIYHNINNSILNDKIKSFYLVCFISIIRKSSFSDDVSPKPYVSTKIKKTPLDPFIIFEKIVFNYLEKFNSEDYNLYNDVKYIGDDARIATSKKYFNKVKLICASPPYINAFDYVRILRLENIWLRNLDDDTIIQHKVKQIGTEQIYSEKYNTIPSSLNLIELDSKIKELFKLDKKRAHIVKEYFSDMENNLISMNKYLMVNGHYVMVIGDCVIKDIEFPSYKYIIELAYKNGYTCERYFSYLIKNPYLRIPRMSRGGLIKYDRIIILKKTNGTER